MSFWGLPEREVRQRVERVLVTTGAALTDGVELARQARAALPNTSVALVRGPAARFEAPAGVELVDSPPSLLDELLAADVVITAAGQTALEAAATGTATVAIALVDNQRRNAAALEAADAAVVVDRDDAVAAAAALGHAERVALGRAGQAAVDGFGALRIAFKIARLNEPSPRRATCSTTGRCRPGSPGTASPRRLPLVEQHARAGTAGRRASSSPASAFLRTSSASSRPGVCASTTVKPQRSSSAPSDAGWK